MAGPLLRGGPLWFDSCKSPTPVSDHSVFAFWVVAYGGFDCIYNYYFSINAICVCFEPWRQPEQMSPAETELQPWFLVNISLINFTECNHIFNDKSIFTPCRASGRLMQKTVHGLNHLKYSEMIKSFKSSTVF